MSLYTAGVGGDSERDTRPLVVVNTQKAGANFWTAVQWLGAGLVLLAAYREGQAMYRKHLGTGDSEEEGTSE